LTTIDFCEIIYIETMAKGAKLSRKHFQIIANIIKLHGTSPTAKAMALDFSVAFKKENPRFDAVRFLSACGLERVTLGNGEKVHIVN